VITQRIDFNLFEHFDRNRSFILEDASYPSFFSWFVEGAKPGFLRLNSLWRTLRHVLARIRGRTTGPIGYAFEDLLTGDLSYNTCLLLCMGIDRSNGVMKLANDGWLDLEWPRDDSRSLYEAIIEEGKHFCEKTDAAVFFPMPTWWWPFRKNISVHALGGCILGDNPNDGVTSSEPATFGQVYGYQNLYVSDGSIVPSAVGANPSATISALSELVAKGITGIEPTASL
jgi:cholesterol oxidase